MRAWCQLGSNRFYVNSEQTNVFNREDSFSGGGSVFGTRRFDLSRPILAIYAGLFLFVSSSGSPSLWAQNSGTEQPAATVAPIHGARGFGSQVDESVRFGVSARELYERIEPALVEVLWGGVNTRVQSMGFKVAGEGTYATVIPDGVSKEGSVVVHGNGQERDGRVMVVDEPTGLCLVKAGGRKRTSSVALALRPIENPIYPGTLVFSVNRPGTGEADICVAGRLAGRDSVYHGVEHPMSYYRINMHLLHGTPGSPLLDESGGVVGILTGQKLKEASEHHALPAPVLDKLIRDYEKTGRSSRAWIGASFHLKSTTPQVMSVRDQSPAAQSGLRSGDVILRVGRIRVNDLNDLVDAFYVASIGERLDMEILRGIEKLSMKLIPGELPDSVGSKKSRSGNGLDSRDTGDGGVR